MDKQSKDYEGKGKRRRRRVLKEIRIDEISSVDKPAQEPGVAVLMKRDSDNDLEKRIVLTSANEGHSHSVGINGMAREFGGGETMMNAGHSHPFAIDDNGNVIVGETNGHSHTVGVNTSEIMLKADKDLDKQFTADQRREFARSGVAMRDGSFPIRNVVDLRNAIQAFGRAGNKSAAARHIQRRANALGLARFLPEEGELASAIGKSATDVGSENGDNIMSDDNADIAAIQKRVTDLENQLKISKSFGDLTDEQKVYYGSLDEKDKTAYLTKSAEDRQADIQAEKDANGVVYKSLNGTEYRQNDDQRIVDMAKRADEMEKAFKESESQRETMELRKRAEDQLGNLPGTVDEHVDLLKAIDGIGNEKSREAATNLLKAKNTEMAKAFESNGHAVISKAMQGDANAELDELTKAYVKDNPKIDYYDAYEIITKQNPELYNKAVTGQS